MVTCAPFKASFLCGDSIKLLLHSRAKMDDAALSIGFTNLSGNKYFIPVRNCGTWFVRLHLDTIVEDITVDTDCHQGSHRSNHHSGICTYGGMEHKFHQRTTLEWWSTLQVDGFI